MTDSTPPTDSSIKLGAGNEQVKESESMQEDWKIQAEAFKSEGGMTYQVNSLLE